MNISFIGTVFFVSIPSKKEGTKYIYLVTARHVAKKVDGKQFLLRINSKDGGSGLVKGDALKWFTHPTDSLVDVAVFPYAPPLETYDYKSVPTSMFLSDEIIQSKGIGAGDEVFITGLFAHVTGSKRNLPIVRMGNIAMMPDEVIPTDSGNIEAYLVEARSIGGLSGSPAFVRQTVAFGFGGFNLLGLMHGHWEISQNKINDLSMEKDLYKTVNIGIAIVIPAKKILEVLNHPELVEIRRKNDEALLK